MPKGSQVPLVSLVVKMLMVILVIMVGKMLIIVLDMILMVIVPMDE